MDKPREEMVEFARSRTGSPFKHHFKPNLCDGGNMTLPSCMETGMDDSGYDCMGLVIAGACAVLEIDVSSWPHRYRHNLQLYDFTELTNPEPGDIVLIESRSERTGTQYATHSGIYMGEDKLIHSNGRSQIVDESAVMGIVTSVSTIKTRTLLNSIGDLIA